jgi:hypothetical protein
MVQHGVAAMRRNGMRLVGLMVGAGVSLGVLAYAQSGGGPATNAPNATDMAKTPDMSPDQRVFRDSAYNRKDERKQTKAQTIQEVSDLLDGLQLSCKVSDAKLVAQGPIESGGRKIDTKTYEAACESGIGYFVISAEKADAFSCFAAEATRAKDIADKREPGIVCTLPANTDSKAMAQAMLTHSGVSCQVSKVRWIGLSAKAATEFTEAACSDGTGYVLTNAEPGSKAPVAAMSCADAGKRGIFCTLTSSGQPNVTLQTFRNELARHNVACTASDENIRHIGQETTWKRHVVEFKCAERPKGLVAYIPLADSTAPFEVVDCATAAKRKAQCKLQ